MMTSQDISGALKRRMRTLRADNIIPVEHQLNLLHNSQNPWSGPFVGVQLEFLIG